VRGQSNLRGSRAAYNENAGRILEKAITFEQLAAQEKDDVLRVSLEKQAAAYRKLAAERAKRLKPQEPLQSS
jgi:hypothetical protein